MFPLLSPLLYGCLPNMCPSELTLHVTWCNRAIRTSPAQTSASVAPTREPVMAHPSPKGRASVRNIQSGASLEMATTSRSPSRVAAPTLRAGLGARKEPTDVGVKEPPQPAKVALLDRPGRVGVAYLVGVHVVTAVMRHPTDQRTFRRHRSGHPEGDPQGTPGVKAPVGEEAMETKRNAESRDDIERRSQSEIEPSDPVTARTTTPPGPARPGAEPRRQP